MIALAAQLNYQLNSDFVKNHHQLNLYQVEFGLQTQYRKYNSLTFDLRAH